MKRILMISAALLMSILCTACLNNFNDFAVQELNNKAKEYLNKGEIEKAICRLESNVDLNGNIFETRYNLSVAYIQAKEFEKALAQIKIAKELNPENTDVYYLEGACEEGIAASIEENNETSADGEAKEAKKLSEEDKANIAKHLDLAIGSYEKYIAENPNAEDKVAVEEKITELTGEITKYDPTYKKAEPKSGNAEN